MALYSLRKQQETKLALPSKELALPSQVLA